MSERLSPFDVVTNINEKKGFLNVDEVGFEAFVINRVFSNTQDTVLFANEMNACWGLPKDMQYAFMYHAIPKKKRYGKWHKNQDDKEELELIQEYFNISRHKAKLIHSLLRPHLEEMANNMQKGGRNHGKKSGTD